LRRGEESYYALLDAGVNWFEAGQTMECYIQDGNELEFIITPLIGQNSRSEKMLLNELPEGLSRLRIHLYLKTESCMVAEITDLGLGELRQGTGHAWKQEINLY
jgi:hypothetical protein